MHEAALRTTHDARVFFHEIEDTTVVEGKKFPEEGGLSETVAMISVVCKIMGPPPPSRKFVFFLR